MTCCRIGHMKQIRNMIPSLKFNMFDPLRAGLSSELVWSPSEKLKAMCGVYWFMHVLASLALLAFMPPPVECVCFFPTPYTTVHCHWKPASQLNPRKKGLITHHQLLIPSKTASRQRKDPLLLFFSVYDVILTLKRSPWKVVGIGLFTKMFFHGKIPASSMFIPWVTCWWFRITCWWFRW